MKTLIAFGILFIFIIDGNGSDKHPSPLLRSFETSKGGSQIERTIITFDKNTSREDVIHTCTFLAGENTKLIFKKLEIGKPFFGLLGKNRLMFVDGSIELPNGSTQTFKAGGPMAFRSVQIIYSRSLTTNEFTIEMIEVID